jgi:UDP-galactose transporter B1
MGTLVERRQYSPQQWVSALCISFGIAAFNLSRIEANQQNNTSTEQDGTQKTDHYWKGMGLLFISLCMDGFLGSFQGMLKRKDKIGKLQPPTAMEMMLFVNFYALLLLIPMAIVSGQWGEGIQLLSHDSSLLSNVLLLNGVVSIGQIFIFLTIDWYSSLVCTTITTTRKFFTILFSVLHFGHKFSTMQWVSVCLVFSGLYLSIAATNHSYHEPKEKSDAKDKQE